MIGFSFVGMTVKELKEYLADKPDEAICYASIWGKNGEKKNIIRLSNKEGNLSKCGKYLRVSWTDDCLADSLPNN
jgi:hypothetical protein